MVEKFEGHIEKTKSNESKKVNESKKSKLNYKKQFEKELGILEKEKENELKKMYEKNGFIEQQIQLGDIESVVALIYKDYVCSTLPKSDFEFTIQKSDFKFKNKLYKMSRFPDFANAIIGFEAESEVVKKIGFENLIKNLGKQNLSKIQVEVEKDITHLKKMLADLNNSNSKIYNEYTQHERSYALGVLNKLVENLTGLSQVLDKAKSTD